MSVGKPKSVIYTPKGHDDVPYPGGGGGGGSTGNGQIRSLKGNKDKKIIY